MFTLADVLGAFAEEIVLDFKIDITDRTWGGGKSPPRRSGGDGEGKIEERIGFATFTGAADDHFAALMEETGNEFCGFGRFMPVEHEREVIEVG